jgi:hypothetical protein
MFLKKPNPAVQGGAGNDLLGGSSQFSDSNIGWKTQHIALRYSIPKRLAPLVIRLAYGEMPDG